MPFGGETYLLILVEGVWHLRTLARKALSLLDEHAFKIWGTPTARPIIPQSLILSKKMIFCLYIHF